MQLCKKSKEVNRERKCKKKIFIAIINCNFTFIFIFYFCDFFILLLFSFFVVIAVIVAVIELIEASVSSAFEFLTFFNSFFLSLAIVDVVVAAKEMERNMHAKKIISLSVKCNFYVLFDGHLKRQRINKTTHYVSKRSLFMIACSLVKFCEFNVII